MIDKSTPFGTMVPMAQPPVNHWSTVASLGRGAANRMDAIEAQDRYARELVLLETILNKVNELNIKKNNDDSQIKNNILNILYQIKAKKQLDNIEEAYLNNVIIETEKIISKYEDGFKFNNQIVVKKENYYIFILAGMIFTTVFTLIIMFRKQLIILLKKWIK